MWDILSTIFMTSYPLFLTKQTLGWLHHTWHMYDIFCTTEDVTSTLSHQATILMTSHPLQAWHHTPCIRHRTNCIFVITNSPLISNPLFMTSHPLLYGITPTMCDIICTIYIIISTVYVITLLYLWQHDFDIWNHIQYDVQNIHSPCDVTVTSLCHHTHYIDSITPPLCMTSHSA